MTLWQIMLMCGGAVALGGLVFLLWCCLVVAKAADAAAQAAADRMWEEGR